MDACFDDFQDEQQNYFYDVAFVGGVTDSECIVDDRGAIGVYEKVACERVDNNEEEEEDREE